MRIRVRVRVRVEVEVEVEIRFRARVGVRIRVRVRPHLGHEILANGGPEHCPAIEVARERGGATTLQLQLPVHVHILCVS